MSGGTVRIEAKREALEGIVSKREPASEDQRPSLERHSADAQVPTMQ